MAQPLAIDLFCGLGGWTEGLLAEGYYVIGVDIEEHIYGDERYPAELMLADCLTLHGAQFNDASLIVSSSPCTEYSYMAMPWSKAKAKAAAIHADETGEALRKLNALFEAQFRIQREASKAAGQHIPMVAENVRGAQPWVGPAAWSYGSYYLWGDVPALMPPLQGGRKNPGFRIGSPGQTEVGKNPVHAMSRKGIKGSEGYERDHPKAFGWKKPSTSSHSKARKAASAKIAKIPLTLSRHIARVYRP